MNYRIVSFGVAKVAPCTNCHVLDVPFEVVVCPSCNTMQHPRVDLADFIRAICNGEIVDVRDGGLVLGREHNEDDIPMVMDHAEGIFRFIGEMMGGEFIVNRESSLKHRKRLEQINANYSSDFEPLDHLKISRKTRVFNTQGSAGVLGVYIDNGQFIVNRKATRENFEELERINEDR